MLLKNFLTKFLACSNKEAISYCQQGLVFVDNVPITQPNFFLLDHQEVKYENNILRKKTELLYVLFNKPYLYECTANRAIKENMYEIIPAQFHHLFTLGRLDKNSEGLLLLTNDGNVYANMVDAKCNIEKEYLVTLHLPITQELENAFLHPFVLGNRTTLPAKFTKISEYECKITLIEGINRQIRRICAKSNNQVKRLIRVRFGNMQIGNLKPSEWIQVSNFLAE